MHPIVSLIVTNAAKEFGKELGGEVGAGLGKFISAELFGTARESNQTNIYLEKILVELSQINFKISKLIDLVEDLPEIILGELRQDALNDAYRLLDIAIERGPDVNRDEDQLIASWSKAVEMESRPDKLMLIPYYTEGLRALSIKGADAIIKEELAAKLDEFVDAEKELSLKINIEYEKAEKLFKATRHGLKDYEDYILSPESPFFAGVLNTNWPPKKKPFWDDGEYLYLAYNKLARKIMYNRRRAPDKLGPLRKKIRPARDALTALTPPKVLLEEYVKGIYQS